MSHRTSWTKTLINLESGTILTRKPFHWLLLLIFYTLFFCGIISLWCFCYWIFQKTLSDERPKWLLTQPGFTFEPALTHRSNYLGIEYKEHSEEQINSYINHLNTNLKRFNGISKNYFGPECKATNNYGYNSRKPCIFLKINRIIGFKTKPIESLHDLPYNVPFDLYNYLENLSKRELKQRIWVSCNSNSSLNFKYFPQRFYATTNVDMESIAYSNITNDFYNSNDIKRIIAVQLLNINPNVKYHIQCFLWAKNIVQDLKGKMGKGLVRFSFEIKN